MDGRRARALLGVDDDAGPAEIRRAFRARVLLAHPDRGGDRGGFELTVAALAALRAAPVAQRAVLALAPARRVDVYDSAARPRPRRAFEDALRTAMMQLD